MVWLSHCWSSVCYLLLPFTHLKPVVPDPTSQGVALVVSMKPGVLNAEAIRNPNPHKPKLRQGATVAAKARWPKWAAERSCKNEHMFKLWLLLGVAHVPVFPHCHIH